MSDSMAQAMKEGISFDDPAQNDGQPADAQIPGNDVQTGATTVTSPETDASKSGGDPAKVVEVAKETELPFHKHPKWQRMNEENRTYRERLEKMEERYQKLLETSIFSREPQQQGQLAPEQRQAILHLANLFKSDPEAAAILGLDTPQELRQTLESMQNERTSESFWGEFDSVVDRFATTYGMDKDKTAEELQEFLTSDARFSNLPYSKGNVEMAAQVMLFGRIGELKEREINAKLIKDKQQKASNNTESPTKNGSTEGQGIDLSKPGGIMERIRNAGGLSV